QAEQQSEPELETQKQATGQAATMPEKETTAAAPEVYEESPAVRMLNEQELEKLKAKQAAGLTDERVTQSVETTVITGPKPVLGMEPVNFMDFDLNGDGVLARDEVGEKLFRSFDLDGNQVIDNIEMETVNVMTFIPMEKETIEVVEYYDGEQPEQVSISREEFLETSQLIAFDEDKDGLSPLDFIGKPFNQIDVKNDKVIDLEEWKRAYEELTKKPHEENFRYNG